MKIKIFAFITLLICCLTLHAQGVSYNQEFQVNTYTYGDQMNPNVSYLLNGGFVVCWHDWVPDSSVGNIYGQLFNGNGSKHGTEFQVNTYTKDDQALACVSAISNDKFIVCWQSYGQDGNHQGIFGQIFYNDGLKYLIFTHK